MPIFIDRKVTPVTEGITSYVKGKMSALVTRSNRGHFRRMAMAIEKHGYDEYVNMKRKCYLHGAMHGISSAGGPVDAAVKQAILWVSSEFNGDLQMIKDFVKSDDITEIQKRLLSRYAAAIPTMLAETIRTIKKEAGNPGKFWESGSEFNPDKN